MENKATVPVLTIAEHEELAKCILQAIRILMTCHEGFDHPLSREVSMARKAAWDLRESCISFGHSYMEHPDFVLESPYFNICWRCYCDLTGKERVDLHSGLPHCAQCVVEAYPFLQLK
jgi:hypothetical protein